MGFIDNIEVFYMGADEFNPEDESTWMGEVARELLEGGCPPEEVGETCEGWWWWYCQPGCLPDSEAHGPERTEDRAWQDAARDWLDGRDSLPVSLSTNDDHEQTEEGWLAFVTLYTDREIAQHDQSVGIDGQMVGWETPYDMTDGYASLCLSGPGKYTDEAYEDELDKLREQLEKHGYSIEDED